jgi:hypothetical protein
MTTFTIAERFRGPPGSANGGYACGLTAAPLGSGPVQVTLHLPPPLGRPLTREVEGDEVRLRDRDAVVATARPVDHDPVVPDPVGPDAAAAAVAAFDLPDYEAGHIYPGCFTCGPARTEGDGLRLFPGATGDPGSTAWPWVPDPSVADDDGVEPAIIWAALDCPGGTAWLRTPDLGAIVLGRLTARIHRRPAAGEHLIVAGWTGERNDRRLGAGSAVWTATGELAAAAAATWIRLSPEQAAAFGAATTG